MTHATARHVFGRLTRLRQLREDRTRKALAAGHARLTLAMADLDREAALRDQMALALPDHELLHLGRAAQLGRPDDSLEMYLAAILADRAHLERQSGTVDTAEDNCDRAKAGLSDLRATYLRAVNRREATEKLGTLHRTAAHRQQSLRDEDVAADQSRSKPEGPLP
jgi:hypothetical protein